MTTFPCLGQHQDADVEYLYLNFMPDCCLVVSDQYITSAKLNLHECQPAEKLKSQEK